MADVLTFEEHRGPIAGRTVAWTGDANNVLASWVHAAERFDFTLRVATPDGARAPSGADRLGQGRTARASRSPPTLRGGRRRRLRRHRLLGLDGRRRGPSAQPAAPLPGRRPPDGGGGQGRAVHALPACPSRRGGHGRGHGRAAIRRLRRGGEPAACAEGRSRLVPRCRPGPAAGITARQPLHDRRRPHRRSRAAVRRPRGWTCAAASCASDPAIDTHPASPRLIPTPSSRALAEATALTLLLGTALKFDGRFILQTRTDGSLRMIVVDFQAPDRVRACATFDADVGRGGRRGRPGRHHRPPRHRPPRHDHRPGAGHGALPGRRGARGREPRGGRRPVFPPIRADPDAGPPRRRRELLRGGGKALAGRRPDDPVPAVLARADARRPTCRPATRRKGRDLAEPASAAEDDAWIEAKALLGTVEDHELIDPTVAVRGAALPPLPRARRARLRQRAGRRAMPLLARVASPPCCETSRRGPPRHGRRRRLDHRSPASSAIPATPLRARRSMPWARNDGSCRSSSPNRPLTMSRASSDDRLADGP